MRDRAASFIVTTFAGGVIVLACLMAAGTATTHAKEPHGGPPIDPSITVPDFMATCQHVESREYVKNTTLTGGPGEEGWATKDTKTSKWTFVYKEKEQELLVNGRPANILIRGQQVIVAESSADSGWSAGAWTYAIHYAMGEVVASQLAAVGQDPKRVMLVKARAVHMDCDIVPQ